MLSGAKMFSALQDLLVDGRNLGPNGVKFLKENNVRDGVLSSEEYSNLLTHCLPYLKPIMKLAYFTGMRLGEILGLTWGQVDLKEGFINPTTSNKT